MKRTTLLFLGICFCAAPAAGQEFAITEFLAQNGTGLADRDGDRPDWIELQNLGRARASLAGYHLTDDPRVLDRWRFPAVELEPGEILVVFASGKDRAVAGQELHTSFRLDGDGEYLALIKPDGATIHQEFAPAFPPQREDVSYGATQTAAAEALVGPESAARYLVPADGGLGLAWTQPGFDAAAWKASRAGIGYDIEDADDPLPGAIVNVALRGAASQSTTGYGGLAARGIDGNTDGNYGGASVTHTADGDPAPTWEVELPAAHELKRIVLWNRTDCCSLRLSNFRVSVFDDPEAEVFSEDFFTDGTQAPAPGAGFEVPLPEGTRGRFVRVELLGGNPQGTRYLSLAEVEVYGVEAAPPPAENLARGKRASQSTTALGGLASRAVDGNTSGIYAQNTITHTSPGDPKPYWQVDLGAVYSVGRVALWNRLDCCSHRLSNFRLLVLDGALAPVAQSDHFTDRGAPAANPYEVVLPPGVLGRHVRIEKLGPDGQGESILSLAEVEVFQAVPGFGPLIRTDVEGDLHGAGSSIYLRLPFQVDDPRALSVLRLRLRYDDGLVAYLNGREVARRNAPAAPAWDSRAVEDRPEALAFSVEEVNLSEHLDALRPGENLLALHGLSTGPTDANFLLVPELSASAGGRGAPRYFTAPTPGALNGAQGLLGFVADTKFSFDRGFYEAPLAVEITTETPGAQIRFTTDGSPPQAATGTVYQGPIPVATTTTLRAAAFKDGFGSTNVDTHTYVFARDVLKQTGAGFPPTWGGYPADYQMDPNVVNDPLYRDTIAADLQTIPSLSIVMKTADLFGPQGIYSNTEGRGDAWERPCSMELIYPEGVEGPRGVRGHQVNCGVRIYGFGWRSHDATRKHAFRLMFKRKYGPARLNYRFFPDFPVRSFDSLVLRSQGSKGWSDFRVSIEQTQYIHDAWARYSEKAMGNLPTSSSHVHLYLNGLYWGLYNPVERPDAEFMAEHLGGSEEDYDALNARVGAIEVIDGSRAGWDRVLAMARAPNIATLDGYRAIREWVDVPNLINFMLINFYASNVDWVGSSVYPGNNMRVAGGPGELGGYKFFCWDFEYSFFNVTDNNVQGVPSNQDTTALVYNRLKTNPEFRLRFADHIQKHLQNDGALTPDRAAERWEARAQEIDRAIVGESARWGDSRREPPYTRNKEWVRELNRLMTGYFPQRTQILFNQLKQVGLYPAVEAPRLGQHGGRIPAGFALTMASSAQEVFYTLDGADPRLEGGALSPLALKYEGAVTLERSALVRARGRSGTGWSALTEATFYLDVPPSLRITEVHYHPEDPDVPGFGDADDFEFIEVKNVGAVAVDLAGAQLREAVEFDFAAGDVERLGPGEVLIVVKNVDAFGALHDLRGLKVAGEYAGRLSNGGDRIILEGPLGETILDFAFLDTWEQSTDGGGYSLVIRDPAGVPASWGDPASWKASAGKGGSPGKDEEEPPRGGLQLPGDANRDRVLDLSDAITVLKFLFLGGELEFPCGDGKLADPGNLFLFDLSGDGGVDLTDPVFFLSYLFLGGPVPVPGKECVPVMGCAEGCGPPP